MSLPKDLQRFTGSIGEILGEGDFGQVVSTSKGFAVKISGNGNVNSDTGMPDPDPVRDGSLARLCQNPYVIEYQKIHFDSKTGTVYLAMPLGQSLPKVPPRKEWKKILIDMANGILACRRVGVIHADVKPDNFLQIEGKTILADFGLAFAEGFIPEGVNRPGYTPGFKAPEIIKGGKPSFETDVWALGVILVIWLLKGENPLMEIFNEKALQAIANLRPDDPYLSTLRLSPTNPIVLPELEEWQSEFLDATLDLNPESRAGVDEILEILTGKRPEIPSDRDILDNQSLDPSDYDFHRGAFERGLRWIQKFQEFTKRPVMVTSFAISTLKAILFQRTFTSKEIPAAAAVAYYLGDIYFGPEPWQVRPSAAGIGDLITEFQLDCCQIQKVFQEYANTMDFELLISHPAAYQEVETEKLLETAKAVEVTRLDSGFFS